MHEIKISIPIRAPEKILELSVLSVLALSTFCAAFGQTTAADDGGTAAKPLPAASQNAQNVPANSQNSTSIPAGSQNAPGVPAANQNSQNAPAGGQNAAAVPAGSKNASSAPPTQFQFNLSSTKPCVPAGHHHDFQFADITVAGQPKTIVPTDILTPGEYVALHQVLLNGSQTIQLDADGKAVGGRFRVDPQLELAIKELAVSNPVNLNDDSGSQTLPGQTKKKVVAGSGLADEEWIQADGSSSVVSGTAVKIHAKHAAKPR